MKSITDFTCLLEFAIHVDVTYTVRKHFNDFGDEPPSSYNPNEMCYRLRPWAYVNILNYQQPTVTMKGNLVNMLPQEMDFFDALQTPIYVIDSDIVGSARILWNVRMAKKGLAVKYRKFKFRLNFSIAEVSEKIIDLFASNFSSRHGFVEYASRCVNIGNLFLHPERGILYFPIGFDGKQAHDVPAFYLELKQPTPGDTIYELSMAYCIEEDGVLGECFSNLVASLTEIGAEENPKQVTRFMERNGNVESRLVSIGSKHLAHQAYYPWLKIPLEEYFAAFEKSDANLLLLYGEPGTAKTTMVRSLAKFMNREVRLVDGPKVIELGGGTDFDPKTPVLLIVEDADQLTKKRENGNDVMTTLLNLLDGAYTTNLKMVISTNLPSLNHVDAALIRPGRCFDVMHFRHLEGIAEIEPVMDILKITEANRPELRDDSKFKFGELVGFLADTTTHFSARKQDRVGFV